MDMMEVRRRVMLSMGVKLPDFISNIEFGSFTLDTAPTSGQYDVQLSKITDPKVILLYSNDFNCYDAKADKPMLGAFGATWIKPNDAEQTSITNGWYNLAANAFYFVNWGENTDQRNAKARQSRTEGSRGIYLFKPSTKTIRFAGFNSSQSEYDFKLGITYHWVVIE